MELFASEAPSRFRIDGYSIQEKIGQGGFGHIYKAKHSKTGQTVAIKFLTLNVDFDNAKRKRYVDRFERETQLVSRLQHPNIVRLLDKGECDDNQFYAVFEYVEGVTLKEMLAEAGRFSAPEAADVMSQVLDSLVHAHEQGVIHRDIKPSNIMLTQVGAKTHVKILDFGIGSLTKEARQLEYQTITLTQETLGTPSYSAPEQLRGEPPTPKTDLYVWGLVFLECLTGVPAISGGSLASIFHKQLSPSNVPLPAAIAGHPVAELLRRVLNKKTSDRASSANEIYRDLKLINFSTLVNVFQLGEPGLQCVVDKDKVVSEDSTITMVLDDQALLYTGLTEKKQITVLAVLIDIDIDIDPEVESEVGDEVYDALLRDQKNQCIDIAIRYGAFHVGTLAGNMLFYFGYPVVSDSDSRLCARTALEISSTISRKNALLKNTQGYEFIFRMGINTGLVTHYADAVPDGRAVNWAMDIAYEAASKQVLCSRASQSKLEAFIHFKSAKNMQIRNFGEVDQLFQVIGERTVEAFGFLRGNRANYEFVGRQQELKVLTDLLDKSELSAAVHVHGEAGIGKSRLINELRSQASNFQHTIAQCLPEYSFNALHPILEALKHKYSLDLLEPEMAVSALKGALLNDKNIDADLALPLLCSWLHLPLAEDAVVKTLKPEDQKMLVFEALISLFVNDSGGGFSQRSNLFVFEDMHWSDPVSIEFIDAFVSHSSFKDKKNIFICTSRKDIPKGLIEAGLRSIEVMKLSVDSVRKFLVSLFDGNSVSENVLDLVSSRADGIPLFIEELAIMLQHKNIVQHLNGIIDFVSSEAIDKIPDTLLESLQQKLDALVYAKETAQLASVIGREFDYELLVKASTRSEDQIQIALDELVTNELIYQQRKVGGDSYIFKHALVRDAAYEGMPRDRCGREHARIAIVLEKDFPNYVIENPAVIAKHFSEGRNYTAAVKHGIKAIKQQVDISSNSEAVLLSEMTMTWIDRLEDANAAAQTELELNNLILPAFIALDGWGGLRVIDLSRRSEELIERLKKNQGSDEAGISREFAHKSEWSLFLYYHSQNQRKKARALGEKLLRQAVAEKDQRRETAICVMLAQTYFIDGDYLLAKELFYETISLYNCLCREQGAIDFGNEYGIDPKVYAYGNLCLVECALGYPDTAIKCASSCIEWSEKTNHMVSISHAYLFKALLEFMLGDREGVLATVNGHSTLYGKKAKGNWVTDYVMNLDDWAYRRTNCAEQFVIDCENSGQTFARPWYDPCLADTYIKSKNIDKAIALMEDSLALCQKSDTGSTLALTHRVLAMSLYKRDGVNLSAVEGHLLAAIDVSKKQKTLWFELEATLDYCQVLIAQGRVSEIDGDLASILSALDQGHSTIKYKAALEVLEKI